MIQAGVVQNVMSSRYGIVITRLNQDQDINLVANSVQLKL
tara:strand:+ start:13673 stop:13792 length:120 start_codon:yes stop_codon:yes gene_type:complete